MLGFFTELTSDVLLADVAVAEKAADFRSQVRSLRMPDAPILATAAIASDVELVVTGDVNVSTVPGLNCRVRLQ